MENIEICFAQDERILYSEESSSRLTILASYKLNGDPLEYLLVTDLSKNEDDICRIFPLVIDAGTVRNPHNEEEAVVQEMMNMFDCVCEELPKTLDSEEKEVQ